jgi:DNA-binding MarR family transcriptional regulator
MVKVFGVTAQQRFVIRCVGKFPGMTAGQLARVLHLDPGTVSTTLNRLEHQRLLVRRRDPRDRRRVHLRLTARGRVIDHRSSGTVEHAVERLFRTSSSSSIIRARTVVSWLIELLHAEAE